MQRNSSVCGSNAAQWWFPASDGLALPIDHSFNDDSGSLSCGENQPLLWPLSCFGSLLLQSVTANDWPESNTTDILNVRQLQQRPTVLRRPSTIKRVDCTGRLYSSGCPIISDDIQSTNPSGFRKLSDNCPSYNSLGSDGFGSSDESSVDAFVEKEFTRHDSQEFLAFEHHSNAIQPKCDFQRTPFGCDQCGKKFGKATQLARHTRGHLGGKPYSCNVCQRTFSRIDHWKAHEGTHRGEKPFKCAWCPYAATRRDILTRHVRATGCGAKRNERDTFD